MSNTDYRNWLYNLTLDDLVLEDSLENWYIRLKHDVEWDTGYYIPIDSTVACYNYTDEDAEEAKQYVITCINGGNITRLNIVPLEVMERNAEEYRKEGE